MKELVKILFLVICSNSFAYATDDIADVGVQFEFGQPYYPERECYVRPNGRVYCYDEPGAIWVGPGMYYGIWFNNQVEFNEWEHRRFYHRRHYRYHHHGHGHHRGGHHR